MHILHVALGGCLKAPPVEYGLSEDTGGHIAYILGAATRQAQRGARVDIVTRAFDTFGPHYMTAREAFAPNGHIIRLRTQTPTYLTKAALWDEVPALTAALRDHLRKGPRPDVIHAHFADAAEVALAVGRSFDIPVVYTPHSLALDKVGGGVERRRIEAERRAIRTAAAIIVSSRDEVERQITAYDPNAMVRARRISPGVTLLPEGDAKDARALLAGGLTDMDRPMVLAIARPVAKKNLIALVRAFACDAALRDRANLVILAGQHATAEPAARRLVEDLRQAGAGMEEIFALPPAHTSHHVAGLYRLAAETRGVFVNPALFEPFGLTLLEAAQAGLPVVATRHGGPSAILRDLDHGHLIDPQDPADIARACRALIGDAAAWDRASAKARAGVGRYDWDRYALESLTLYRSLRTARPAPLRRMMAEGAA
ncbi:glycosyltransferase [Falsirhodobacter halotolerans]|uniref:glycosyltransferase n=1 Tax=Falsirhodobacter halotolerans TaxID=1146892 RepID=UPI001FD1BDD2|nr:glycosyltransferase [Falsirhodobacter halotolerans]MCJ8141245.1 glycosyltransferase [Falsirhodobacter halotolerans]